MIKQEENIYCIHFIGDEIVKQDNKIDYGFYPFEAEKMISLGFNPDTCIRLGIIPGLRDPFSNSPKRQIVKPVDGYELYFKKHS